MITHSSHELINDDRTCNCKHCLEIEAIKKARYDLRSEIVEAVASGKRTIESVSETELKRAGYTHLAVPGWTYQGMQTSREGLELDVQRKKEKDMKEDEGLGACPFCGASVDVLKHDNEMLWMIVCRTKGCYLEDMEECNFWWDDIVTMREAWNKRRRNAPKRFSGLGGK